MTATDLRIPGPTPLPPAVMQAMQQEMFPPRSARFASFFRELLDQVKQIHGTDGHAVVLPGTGSSGWEIAIVNTLSPGDTVIAVTNGNFGERFAMVAETFGLNVVRVDVPWGKAATSSQLKPALEAHPDARAVLYVHNETSTAVTNPLHEIGPLVRAHGALLLVDGVSSVGGIPVEMDAWNVDLMLSGTQKAWMCPPGLVVLGVGPRVMEAYERSTFPRFFWDLKTAIERGVDGFTPTTAPLTMLFALKAACDMILDEGLENLYQRHARMGALVRQGVTEIGYELFADEEYASDTVTMMTMPDGLTSGAIIERMSAEYGIDIASGIGKMRDSALRIGHMGWVHAPELERTLAALDDVTKKVRG